MWCLWIWNCNRLCSSKCVSSSRIFWNQLHFIYMAWNSQVGQDKSWPLNIRFYIHKWPRVLYILCEPCCHESRWCSHGIKVIRRKEYTFMSQLRRCTEVLDQLSKKGDFAIWPGLLTAYINNSYRVYGSGVELKCLLYASVRAYVLCLIGRDGLLFLYLFSR